MRPTRDQWALSMALLTARRATCPRRQVGCVLLDGHGHVIATGYNGVAAKQPHCSDSEAARCPGAELPSGTGLDACQAIHAEQNAMLQCRNVYSIHTCYVTTSPCMTCIKLLLNTTCQRIVFVEAYTHTEAKKLWESAGRKWEQLTNLGLDK